MSGERIRETVAAIRPPDNAELAAKILGRLNSLTKPPGSLGKLEDLALRYGLIRGTARPELKRKAMYLFCADHGVTEEGVSPYPAEVTRQMVENFLAGGAAITVLCRHHGIETVIVDMGVRGETAAGVVREKIAGGTRNFTREPAMTREQAERSIETGIRLAHAADAPDVLAAGEMGIGNSTAAAALMSAFTGRDAAECAGRGTGVDDAGLARKVDAIRRGLALHRPDPRDGTGVLAAVGGFEIGAIAGLILGAAAARRMVVLDGFISTSAALIARALAPDSLQYVCFSHLSAERGHRLLLDELGGEPLLSLDMRLGEGSGAALGVGIVEAAVKLYNEMATFAEAGVSDK
ncbi:MAG: nicotinate-nucleotide--dimethylbenzimidazole phosphoribosyltransferase [Bryobacteraceae bacterium]